VDADVIVVGAGPAGSTAACDLARRGHDVLLLDRKAFPRDKTCGDGVPPGSIEILNDLGMADQIRSAGFYPINGIRIGSPSGRMWETGFRPKRPGAEFYIAPRERFDGLIYDHAVKSGARFVEAGVRRTLVERGRVVGVSAYVNGRETAINARVVIGADGATSAVARSVQARHTKRLRDRSVAIRAYVEGIETLPHRVEFYFHKKFVPGYGWIFPLGSGRANVGVIVRVDRLRRTGETLESLLEAFLESPAVGARLRSGHRRHRTAAWQLPIGSHKPSRKSFSGALLVGDAAALVDPLTGEGIHSALVSARIAADVAARAVETGDTSPSAFSDYDRRCDAALGRLLRRSHYISRSVALAPWWVDVLFMAANANPRLFESLLNRQSTDFVVQVPR
jgi:geranylgeranyl reductase family protein